ncbi:hypothetical protein [Pseudopelagicola sp. nBUS_19]|uniref:hypothetical protein n=1 Tax=Pseudopelagicola sp. nBUS_19 TaxID=3395316 RepID=UPI003EBEAAB8
MSQIDKTDPNQIRTFCVRGNAMQGVRSKIQLVIITIGAERGRAARGRPKSAGHY